METVSAITPTDMAEMPWHELESGAAGTEMPLPFEACKATLLRLELGSHVPAREQREDAFYIVLRGRVESPDHALEPGSVLLPSARHAPWSVPEETYVLALRDGGARLQWGDAGAREALVRLEQVPWREFFCVEHGYSHELHPDPRLEVKLIRYKTGATIPRHYHTGPTLSTIVRGLVETPYGVLGVGSIFWCRGVYGPWKVHEDLVILIAQNRGTEFVPTATA